MNTTMNSSSKLITYVSFVKSQRMIKRINDKLNQDKHPGVKLKTKHWIAFITLGIIWSSSFLWIKIGVQEVGPTSWLPSACYSASSAPPPLPFIKKTNCRATGRPGASTPSSDPPALPFPSSSSHGVSKPSTQPWRPFSMHRAAVHIGHRTLLFTRR